MTIRFTKSWNGHYEGQIVSNPAGGNTEAQLIALGYAVADLDGPDNSYELAKFATDSSGNVTGLVGPGGLVQGTPRMIAGDSSYQASILNHATNSYDFCGYDAVDSTVFIKDTSGGVLRQGTSSDAWEAQANATFTGNKTLPTSPNAVLYTGIAKIIRFKNQLYLLAKDSVTNLYGIYRTDPTPGATAFTWSAPLKQMTSSAATALYTGLDADASYMYLGEYGDPVGGPTVWRSADGDTWTQIYTEIGGSGGSQRHMHAIAADPYNAGHVWMTLGDANAPRETMRSIDYGTTWTLVTASSKYQGVQISFSPSWVYIAGDSQRGIAMAVRRSDNAIFWASSGSFKNLPVVAPAAVSDSWYHNAWIGVVDPLTGEYYCSANDSSAGGNTPGVFCVPYPGATPVLIEKPGSIASPIAIAAGFLWFGKYRRKLHGK